MPEISFNGQPLPVGEVRRIAPDKLGEELAAARKDGADNIAFQVGDALYVAPLMGLEGRGVVPGSALTFGGKAGTVVAVDDEENTRTEQRQTLAAAESTPAATLALLAEDPDPMVRLEVASNSRTPQEVIAALSADPDPRVRLAAFTWR